MVIDPNGAMYGGMMNTAGNDPGLTVQQAYAIDRKMDDGLPQTGNVTAMYDNWALMAGNGTGPAPVWASGGGIVGAAPSTAPPSSSSTCYDNGGGNGPMQYSVEISNGANVNCALSFRFQ